MRELTPAGKDIRQRAMAHHRARGRTLLLLVFLGVLPLPLIAYALGAYVVTGGQTHPLLGSQLLLLVAAVLIAGVGGFLIWSTTASLARATEVDARLEHLDSAVVDGFEPSGPITNSVARMLATIERQTSELNQVAERLDAANREVESTNARLREVSFIDDVTKLYNRRFFSIRLGDEVARHRRFGHPLSLALFDLDHFKAVNDELGHPAGDETLRGVADHLAKNSRSVDVVCRYGGDEFAVLLVETPRSGSQHYAERILDGLATASFSHGRQVTASVGVSSLPEDAATGDDLVRTADEALYAAKRGGKNSIALWADLGIVVRTRSEEAPAL